MAKVLQTDTQIAALVMHAASRLTACKGLTGVTIGRVHDDGVPHTWNVTSMHNNTSKECEQAIETVVQGLRLMFDLKD